MDRAELLAAADRIERRLQPRRDGHAYTWDLALEALLALSAASGEARWRQRVERDLAERSWNADTRIPWRKEPFCSLTWAWARASGERRLLDAYVAETEAMRRELPRTADGLVTHPRGASRGGGDAVLLDSFQEYASRLARAGAVSGSSALCRDCAEQVVRHRDVLRDPVSGLWSQGRSWLSGEPERLSPGTWSRGQGWLLRGLVSAAEALPDGYPEVRQVLAEAATAICAHQQPTGMWHALPHRHPHESAPETSGTALIAASLLRAVRARLLPAEPFAIAARRAIAAILPRIAADGVVHDACPGPGPIQDETPWRAPGFAPGDPHGPGTVLEALAAALDQTTT